MEKEKELCMTPVDLAAGGEQLQLLKALVPYLAAGMQKPFVLLIKCMEIQNLTAFFSSFLPRLPILPAKLMASLKFFLEFLLICPGSRENSFPKSSLFWKCCSSFLP